MKADVKNLAGQKVGEIDLSDAVFGVEVKEHLLWEVVKGQLAARRAGTHSTITRAEVRGGRGERPDGCAGWGGLGRVGDPSP